MVGKKKQGKAHNAPDGFYTAAEAQTLLKMPKATFHRNVGERGLQIRRYVPVGSKEGFYSREEIDLLVALREQGIEEYSKLPPTVFRQARAEDAQGVADVLLSLGWTTAPAELLVQWYGINPDIHHVVIQGAIIMGYISAIPFRHEVMERRLQGVLEAKDIKPEDILPFENGNVYDLFVGLAERKKPEEHPEQFARYGLRLVLGFRRFLMEDLFQRNIRIRLMLAHSAEEPGQRLADALGFALQERRPGERYPIYILDMEHSDAPWVKQYRELWKEKEKAHETS